MPLRVTTEMVRKCMDNNAIIDNNAIGRSEAPLIDISTIDLHAQDDALLSLVIHPRPRPPPPS